jgi:iron-sulfur cluster assembly accessory protein
MSSTTLVALPDVTVTPAAEKFMRRMVRFSEAPQGGFRLSVSAGGCSGLASEFSVEAQPKAGDAELNVNGLRLFLPAESRLLLDGVTVDFSDSLAASGLSFIDPKASSCGCSSSAGGSGAEAAKPASATVSLASLKRR